MDITRATARPRISLTPLIDVVFFLLVFFMLTTSFVSPESIHIGFAQATPSDTSPKEKPVIVEIASKNRLLLDGIAYDPFPFREALRAKMKASGITAVAIQNGPDATVQDLVLAIDQVRFAGAEQILFAEK